MSTTTTTNLLPSSSPTGQNGHAAANPYGFIPTEWVCILFVVLFSVSTIIHTAQAIHSRLWWLLLTTCLAGIGEILGWSARVWSSQNVTLIDPYLIQVTTTIIAPTPLIAANFVILGQIICRVGQKYSRISARWYTIIFCSADTIALVVQAMGGANASAAVKKGSDPTPGVDIMLAGVAFQMAALVIYVVFATEFILRYAYDYPLKRYRPDTVARRKTDKNTKLMILGLAIEAVFLFIRSIYRMMELSMGWTSTVVTTEWYFVFFDALMIVFAMYLLNVLHPGRLLGKADTWLPKDNDERIPTEGPDGKESA